MPAPHSHGHELKCWRFDKVFREEHSNHDVFQEVEGLVTSVLDGYNVCIFAYGPTGSGKTYSMEGTEDDPGIFNRTFEELFGLIHRRKEDG